jgi:hypothetical protein
MLRSVLKPLLNCYFVFNFIEIQVLQLSKAMSKAAQVVNKTDSNSKPLNSDNVPELQQKSVDTNVIQALSY